MKSYISVKRQKIGNDLLIHPAARILIENEKGEFLYIIRVDNGNLGIPAGAFEPNETIVECIIREVKEETGLDIQNPIVIGISTNPNLEMVNYPNGDKTQYFTVEFYTNEYSGKLKDRTEEAKAIGFKPKSFINQLPENEQNAFKSLEYYRETGKVYVR